MNPEAMAQSSERHFETACGRVRITKPVAPDVYWRLEWYVDGAESAVAKATEIVAALDAGAASRGRVRVGDALERYLVYSAHHHSPNHFSKIGPDLRKAFNGLERVRCEDLTGQRVRDGVASAPTESSFTHRRSRVNTFLKWGKRQGYFTTSQTDFLEDQTWEPPEGRAVRPTRQFAPPSISEDDRFVTPDQVPSHAAIDRLGDAFQNLLPYGRLLVEFTYSTGVRGGELYALDASSIFLDDAQVAVNWQVLSLSGLPTRKARPKHGRVRTTDYPQLSLNGFELGDALAERLAQVEREYEAGRNPKRLLFPAPRGGWWWATSFTNDYFSKAAQIAEWQRVVWTEEIAKNRKVERGLWVHTMHSLRHRFARDRIDVFGHTPSQLQAVGGWKNAKVLWERYYGQSQNLLDETGAKLSAVVERMREGERLV